ncbi:MAG: response regulator [Calditrichaeota bacterium]|nr:response regulator [Calditrichota bacterium]
MKKILVVDDQKNVRTSISIGLGRVGYQVDVASNAEGALLKLKEKSFDVVLADVRMPDTNGYVLANIIRQLYPNVKIILMSAYDFNEYDKKYQLSYPLSKLAKPFGMVQLLSLLGNGPLSFQYEEMRN